MYRDFRQGCINHVDLWHVWTHDEVERRLQEAMTTLRRLPMPRNGMPVGDRSHWPEVARSFWEIYGGTGAEHRREIDADRNRTKLPPLPHQVERMDEALGWLHMIRDRRHRKVVFARSHIWPDSDRPITSWVKLQKEMGVCRETLRRWYRIGIRDIAVTLSGP